MAQAFAQRVLWPCGHGDAAVRDLRAHPAGAEPIGCLGSGDDVEDLVTWKKSRPLFWRSAVYCWEETCCICFMVWQGLVEAMICQKLSFMFLIHQTDTSWFRIV